MAVHFRTLTWLTSAYAVAKEVLSLNTMPKGNLRLH